MKIKKIDPLYQKVQDEIKKIFMGYVPPQFASVTPEELNAVNKLAEEQDILNTTQPINYVTLIQRIGGIMGPRVLKELKSRSNAKNVERFYEARSQFAILISSLYHEKMQDFDGTVSVQRKIQVGIMIKRLLTTFKDVYKMELMADQEAFIQKIDKNNFAFQLCIDIANSVPESAFTTPNVSEIWKHSEDQLAILAEQLFEHEFVDSASKFLRAFTDDTDSRCNWLKSTSSFMYLMALIFKNNLPQEWTVLFNLLSERFTFKGKTVTPKTLRETTRNGSNTVKNERKYLSGEYGTLCDLHDAILTGKYF